MISPRRDGFCPALRASQSNRRCVRSVLGRWDICDLLFSGRLAGDAPRGVGIYLKVVTRPSSLTVAPRIALRSGGADVPGQPPPLKACYHAEADRDRRRRQEEWELSVTLDAAELGVGWS